MISSKSSLVRLRDQAQQRGVEPDILRARQIGVKSGAELEESGYASVDRDGSGIGLGKSRHQAEQGAFACAVGSHHGHAFPALAW